MTPSRPPESIETARLLLRAFQLTDAADLRALFIANADRFRDSFPGSVDQLVDQDDPAGYIQAKLAAWSVGAGFWYGIWEPSTRVLIGQIQIKNVDWALERAEIAYLLDRASEGKGFITEAIRRLVGVAFDDMKLHRLFLRTIAGNARSEGVAKQCGFRLEGTLREEFLAAGVRRVDLHYFGLLAGDVVPAAPE